MKNSETRKAGPVLLYALEAFDKSTFQDMQEGYTALRAISFILPLDVYKKISQNYVRMGQWIHYPYRETPEASVVRYFKDRCFKEFQDLRQLHSIISH
ncbi:MAG: hypothetical protein WDA42_00845 [Candidatus Bathyarchaeia archaeon]